MNLRRTLVCTFIATLFWALTIRIWGGFLVRVGHVRISSRRYEIPVFIGLMCLAAAFTPFGSNGRQAVKDEKRWWWEHAVRHVVAPVRPAALYVWRLLRPAIAFGIRNGPAAAPIVLMAIIGVYAITRWWPARSLWLDEETIAINLRDRSFAQLAGTLWFGQSAPYGWMVLERAALLVAGASEPVLRLQPMLYFLGTMTVACMAGRRWLNAVGTLVFVACCACSAWIVHYAFEVKPYTADAFWALLVTVVAAWALDADVVREQRKRIWIWWSVAALGLWFANGALLTAPACAVVLVISAWRRDGIRAALSVATSGVIWFASLAACYLVSLRFSLGSHYLYDYWVWALPPADATLAGRFAWLGQQLQPLAENPAGASIGLLLWVVVAAGLLTARRPRLALLAAAAPLTAFALGWLRVVPMRDRVALWITPHLYLAVAMLADRAAMWASAAWRARRWRLVPLALTAAIASGWVVADLVDQRNRYLAPIEQDTPARGDAAAVRQLFASRHPGEAIVTTHQGWPAIWWYGGFSVADGQAPTKGNLPDGAEALELSPNFEHQCDDDLARTIARSRRTWIFVGFPDVPPNFEAELTPMLNRVGTVRQIETFQPGRVWTVEPRPGGLAPADSQPGCLTVKPARRW
jgi:hypothetical protein